MRRLLQAAFALAATQPQLATPSPAGTDPNRHLSFTVPYPVPSSGAGEVELRVLDNQFVLASGTLLEPSGASPTDNSDSGDDALLSSTLSGAIGDRLVAVDGYPLSSASLPDILNTISRASSHVSSSPHILPIVAHTLNPEPRQDPARPPPETVLGFVRISTFVPHNMTLLPTYPPRIKALAAAARSRRAKGDRGSARARGGGRQRGRGARKRGPQSRGGSKARAETRKSGARRGRCGKAAACGQQQAKRGDAA